MNLSRRKLMHGLAAGAALAHLPLHAAPERPDRILVVLELSGGNDGLNTVVPYADDAYYRHRPKLGLRQDQLLEMDDRFGLNPGCLGLKRLWDTEDLAVVHGCGYADPSYSHFTSMAWWHTAAPHSGEETGWVGRLADALSPEPQPNLLINVGSAQSLAVNSRVHTPVVFDDPERFQRDARREQRAVMEELAPPPESHNPALNFVNSVESSARRASLLVREAWEGYQTPVDYGIAGLDLPKVAACIAAGLPTQIYYVSFRNNAFDTHVQQPALHRRLLSYAADAMHGFVRDLERLGVADRVLMMAFSEFGRRVTENANRGTDHGSANNIYLLGAPVKGGHFGQQPDLDDLRDDGNLRHTVDFRQVYATAAEWLQPGSAKAVLRDDFGRIPALA